MKNIKNSSQGFTLLELLVVVLIIGILAAIALPQYQIAVGKSKFATLKDFTRSVAEARNRYFLTHSAYPESVNDLDIDIDIVSSSQSQGTWFSFSTSQDISCIVWTFDFNSSVSCSKNILGKKIAFRVKPDGYSPLSCLVFSEDDNDKANKLCQKETGRNTPSNCEYDNSKRLCIYKY